MAPDADATAGASQGWHDLEAVLVEEPAATLLAAYLAIVDQRILVVLDVVAQLCAMRDKAPGLRRHRGTVEQGSILRHACDPAQSLACLPVLAVPEQVPQPLDIALRMLERRVVQRLQSSEADEGLLD